MSVKSRRQEYKDLTRAALLSAAREQFARRGFAATTIDDIATAARVSKGAVYYHFTDKAELFEAVFREAQQQLLTKVGDAAQGQPDPWEQFDAAIAAYLRGTISDPGHRAILQEAPSALGPSRCRLIDEQLGLPVILAGLQTLERTDELAHPATEVLARILFSALCEAAMAAGTAAHPDRAEREAKAALRAITAGLRKRTP